MRETSSETAICQVSKKRMKISDVQPIATVRPTILELVREDHPDIDTEGYISKKELKKYRQKYIESMLEREKGEVTKLDKEVIKSMVDHETLSQNADESIEKNLTFGERLSDKIAEFGGSWKFIISFLIILLSWIALNAYVLISKPFDPFPFILLNLILSCIAALQAPIIMMSQNRKETKDRIRAENDYKTNLKAELEIRTLHEKIDHLIQNQWQRLIEIQQMQVDILEERNSSAMHRSKHIKMRHEDGTGPKDPAKNDREPQEETIQQQTS